MTVSYLIAREMAPSVCRIIATKFRYTGQHASLLQAACEGWSVSACLYGRDAQVSLFGNAYLSQGRLCIDSLHVHCLVCYCFCFFLWKVNPVFPSHSREKRFKRSGQNETNPRAVSVMIISSPGLLGSLGRYVCKTRWICINTECFLHWDAYFLGVGLLLEFMSPPFTEAQPHKMQILFKATLINSANSDHPTQWCKTNALFLFPKLALTTNFTCAISWVLLLKM